MAPTTREQRKIKVEEDAKHFLDEIWDFDPDESFCKMFIRENKKGIWKILARTKDDLATITLGEDDDTVTKITPNEIGDIRMLVHYQAHLYSQGKFPEDASTFRYNTITLQ